VRWLLTGPVTLSGGHCLRGKGSRSTGEALGRSLTCARERLRGECITALISLIPPFGLLPFASIDSPLAFRSIPFPLSFPFGYSFPFPAWTRGKAWQGRGLPSRLRPIWAQKNPTLSGWGLWGFVWAWPSLRLDR